MRDDAGIFHWVRSLWPERVLRRSFLGCLLLGIVGSGCAGYHLGPTNHRQAGASRIQILPFQNQTSEPRLSDAVGNSLRKQLQQDGTFQLDTHDTGDIVVSGELTRYNRGNISFNPRDIITPRDYQITLTAKVKAVERGTGKVVLEREFAGITTVRIGSDLSSAERQAVPLLAENLARRIASALADGDW